MKKAINQTVRDLKRGVNKNVLKVPVIEQKVLDATSNESWGPHGSLLADIAQASRNYHEYQIIMSTIWKRMNDTGKNWRHVYKALIVLEFLVAHGSERAIDDIREHAYQISTLSDFQYTDHNGKDHGNNVRRKSQSLVILVNDKERIQEVREKAAANRDKYCGPATSGMHSPGSNVYGDRYNDNHYDGQYGNQDDDRNGYGRDRDWGSKDDDRYGQCGDSYGREGGRSQTIEEYNYNSRSISVDRERDCASEDNGQFSSSGSGAKADDHSQDGRHDFKASDQNTGAPPSSEDAVSASRSPTYCDRYGDSSLPNAPNEFSLPGASPGHTTAIVPTSPACSAPDPVLVSAPASIQTPGSVQYSYNKVGAFDEFDPRGSFSAAPSSSSVTNPAASTVDMDFLGSSSESFFTNSSALVPSSNPPNMSLEANSSGSVNPGPSFAAASSASTINNQSFNDPFGDGPFKATPTENAMTRLQISTPPNSTNANSSQTLDAPQPPPPANEFGGSHHNTAYTQSDSSGVQPEFLKHEFTIPNPEIDILADILPLSATTSYVNAQASYPFPSSQSVPHGSFPQSNQPAPEPGLSSPTDQSALMSNFQAQNGQPAGFPVQLPSPQSDYLHQPASFVLQTGQTMPLAFPLQVGQPSQMGFGSMQLNTPDANIHGAYNSQSTARASAYTNPTLQPLGSAVSTAPKMGPQPAQVQSSSILPAVSVNPSSSGVAAASPQPSKDKFETKSSVWADTLSRGLVNLNISGPKTNPLSDIGVDFDAINRKEKRMEKPTATSTVTSTVTMGKAMGSGSGMGRAGVGVLRAPPNPVMNPGINMVMPGGPGASAGIGMGGYAVIQPMGRGIGTGMIMGVGMNMQQPVGFPSGSTMQPGVYMTGTANYGQLPYGRGYQ